MESDNLARQMQYFMRAQKSLPVFAMRVSPPDDSDVVNLTADLDSLVAQCSLGANNCERL